jgi:hypothetical protein
MITQVPASVAKTYKAREEQLEPPEIFIICNSHSSEAGRQNLNIRSENCRSLSSISTSTNMKFIASVSAFAALSSVAIAAPHGGDWKEWKDAQSQFPFDFTSTYAVVATPDQVVNGTASVSTPGEPGAIGYYNYGIQSDLDLICWVRLSFHSSMPAPFPSCLFHPIILGKHANISNSTSPSKALLAPTNRQPRLPRTFTREQRARLALPVSHCPTQSQQTQVPMSSSIPWAA